MPANAALELLHRAQEAVRCRGANLNVRTFLELFDEVLAAVGDEVSSFAELQLARGLVESLFMFILTPS